MAKKITQQPSEIIQPQLNTLNINNFNWRQVFNDSKGKTDGSLIAAFMIVVVACICMLWSTYMQYGTGITGAAFFGGGGATIYSIRRYTNDKEISPEVSTNVVNPVVTAKTTE